MSWRINTIEQDNSQGVDTSGVTIGYTSILAGKGPNEPILIQKGAKQQVLETFGYPSATYPGIQDVLDYITKSQCYVTAPSSGLNELYGGAVIKSTGAVSLATGQTANDDTFDFSSIDVVETVGVGNGVLTNFTLTVGLDDVTEYENTSLVIKLDGVTLTSYAITDAEPEVITATELSAGTYTRATGVIDLTFGSAVADGSVITAEYQYDASASALGVVFDKYPSPDSDKGIKLVSNDDGSFFMSLYLKDGSGNWYEQASSPIEFSLVENDKNGFGQNIYAPIVFENNNFVTVVINDNLTFSSYVDDTSVIPLAGGSRGDTPAASDIAGGYTEAQDVSAYPIDIFFDTTAESAVATVFETMRESYNLYARYLLPAISQSAADHISDPTTSKNSIDNRGIYYYCLNWGIHQDIYNDSPFLCSNMGLIAGKHADIVESGFGGYSPSWIDESGFGGQLGSSIISLTYGASDAQLEQLQKDRLNPVVMDFNYGPMIRASRTTLSVESDYSYIEHSGLADYIISTVVREVLPLQIKKPNDDFHRVTVRSKTEAILQEVEALLEDYAVKCDRENNGSDVLNQKKFVLTVGVQFTPFAKTIDFIFINSRNGVDIQEVVNKG